MAIKFNLLAHGRCGSNFESKIFKLSTHNSSSGIYEIVLSWMLQNLISNLEVNIGLGNGLVPSGTKPLPEPMLTQIHVAIWYHLATVSWIPVTFVKFQTYFMDLFIS